MDRFGVDEVYALHTDPFGPEGEFRTTPGRSWRRWMTFEIT